MTRLSEEGTSRAGDRRDAESSRGVQLLTGKGPYPEVSRTFF